MIGSYMDRPLHFLPDNIGRTEVEGDMSVRLGESLMGRMPRTLDFPALTGKFHASLVEGSHSEAGLSEIGSGFFP